MSDEIVFDVLCTKVLDALRTLGLGKFSIRNYYYEGMWPIIKVYRSEGVIFYSAASHRLWVFDRAETSSTAPTPAAACLA